MKAVTVWICISYQDEAPTLEQGFSSEQDAQWFRTNKGNPHWDIESVVVWLPE